MFGFFKRPQKEPASIDYTTEYRHLLRDLNAQFSVGDSPWERVVNSMAVIDHEMNGNGGANWNESEDHIEFLENLREFLLAEPGFTTEQKAKIKCSLDEIESCGQELVEKGESSRNATDAVNYLIKRTVDWCRLNQKEET